MLNQVVSHTPFWVWPLLLGLLWLGLSQTVTRSVPLRRVSLVALGMAGWSLYGTLSAFGSQGWVLPAWLAGAGVIGTLVLRTPLPADAHYDDWTGRFTIPGSWVPLTLILGIFLTKYTVGASLSLQPALAANETFTLAFSALYGVFSGAFLARAARLLRLTMRENHKPARAMG